MPRTPALAAALVAALALALAFAAAQPAPAAAQPPTASAPVRIMPLGDSITAGPGCRRAYLWDRLQKTGYTGIDFVGTQQGGGCPVPTDVDHEGHGGYSATGIADQDQLPPWPAAARAAAKTTARSPITAVDQWTGFDTTTDTGDGVHPNDAGFARWPTAGTPP
ncbi:hypothetical protein ACFV4N_30080 [Actinosynnema sp. NPDC059797]